MTDPTQKLFEAERLMQEGRAHLDAGSWELAEASFRTAARVCPTSAALNNWALCRHMRGDQNGALEILAPLLQGDTLAPFSRGLASLIHSALGNSQEARVFLIGAGKDFEAGLMHPALRNGVAASAWVEYTLTIKRAAAELGEDRMLLDWHDRWPGRDLALGGVLAGVAAFNLGKYERAARYWRKISEPAWRGPAEGYARVADLVREGLVPPFALEGNQQLDMEKFKDVASVKELLKTRMAARIPLLVAAFAPDMKSPGVPLSVLVKATGEWGVQLGHRVLQTSRTSFELKMAVVRALTEQGILAPGESVKVLHEGRQTEISVRQVELRGPDPDLDRQVVRAQQLRDAGQRDEAYALLNEMELNGVLYPPAMVTLANLRRERGELAKARSTLEALAEAMPDDPAVFFNLAGLSLQEGKVSEARELAAKIDPKGLPPEFRQLLQEFKNHLAGGLVSGSQITPDVYRQDVEDKLISLELSLRSAVKRIPVEWLNAAATVHRIPSVPRRLQREQLVAEDLQDLGCLRRALSAEGPEVRAALRYVLEKGGWCKLQTLTKRYGTMDGDGYWWNQKSPSSVIGRLCLLGLLFVGRAQVDGKVHKVAVIPIELRHLLDTAGV